MNKHKHQLSVLKMPWNGEDVCEVLSKEEFLLVCHGDGYGNWDDDYYCIIEQQIGERIEQGKYFKQLCEQDKEWIKGMIHCDDYANDIISYIENNEMCWEE